MRASEDTQAAFADAVNVARIFLTNSCTLSGRCPVNVSTSSDIRSNSHGITMSLAEGTTTIHATLSPWLAT